jgi:hypothetical protein
MMKHLPNSEKYSHYSQYKALSRRTFAATVFNTEIKGYHIQRIQEFDILVDRCMWPTLCILKGSDGSVNHAVTVVDNYIFESNCPHAIQLSKENLDWCCSTEVSPDVTYVRVEDSYRFVKQKPSCDMLLRSKKKTLAGINSVQYCMVELGNSVAISRLADLKKMCHKEIDVFDAIKNILNRKPVGYQVLHIKKLEEVMYKGQEKNPIVILIKAGMSFHYGILTICNGRLYDGLCSCSMDLTVENIYNSVDLENYYGNYKNVEIIRGYVFSKTQSEKKRNKVMKLNSSTSCDDIKKRLRHE